MLERFLIALVFVSSVPQFHLRDTEGALHTAAEWAARKAVLLYFVTVDCPLANSYVREMNRLREAAEDFGQQRPQATESYVRQVLDAVLSGKAIGGARHKSIGCAIPRSAK